MHERKPTEEDFIQYFDYLKGVKKLAANTIWSQYSMLNHKFQALFGEKLQKFPRITMLLKSYENGYVRKKSKIFSKEQIENFLKNAPDDGEFIHIKVAILLCYFGGLRCADLVNINCSDLESTTSGKLTISEMMKPGTSTSIPSSENVPRKIMKLENCHNVVINF